MKKFLSISAIIFLIIILLCGCGRNDITLTINDNGTIDAEIVYGIDKSMVAGEDVLNQVTEIIKTPLNENKIKYTESEDENFYRIHVKKSFEDAAALANSANWQGIPFVPQFSPDNAENAVKVTSEGGRINFSANLNSDSFNATQILSENKKSFGASITIVAKDGKANIKETSKNTYKWEGTAEDTVKMELSAKYNGGALLPSENSPASETAPESASENTSQDSEPETTGSDSTPKSREVSGKEKKAPYIPIICAAIIIIAIIILAVIKNKKTGSPSEPASSGSPSENANTDGGLSEENNDISEKGNSDDAD